MTRDDYDEEEYHKPRWVGCRDRMCGAEDCPNCHPSTYNLIAQEKEEQ